MRILSLLVIAFLVGCQQPQPGVSTLVLHLRFPDSVKTRQRFHHLLTRTRFLHLSLKTKDGWSREVDSPPGEWETVTLSAVNFPGSETDSLMVALSLWDLKREGTPRTYASLTGKATIRADEVRRETVTDIPLRLSLKVPASEFD